MAAICPRDGLARLTSAMTLTPSAFSAAIASRGDGARPRHLLQLVQRDVPLPFGEIGTHAV